MPTTAKERLNRMLKKGKTQIKEEPQFNPGPGKSMDSVPKELVEPIPKQPRREESIDRFMQRRNKAEGKIGNKGII